ncbi:hypothetical protein PABG_03826 [Paracoccidioides brasiliensis Pb03]|uniref:Stress-response A/B barrel domain-containing protein n=2 Tax=Paracoccidioides brasiliensis TaxID=121759 RepID=C1GJ28_PARBD|nr:uncharacterized protein PADG_07264 [Paracoccidioides brasiliensis Pb18]EEH21610.1 hypothetical protein PABG_03826 [Paracoccidioides brasiliensis Pb03]EEH42444.2 hypothetical protein PADG_07264 [Paracoccidioides brasiliensis Pb18]ODH15490.1 hypothetical protein ACO22_06435 [Paracoccidioides brasiliensis]ODH46000.1 hypothetical protein GX48_07918 [Paracoccidioides brasiliensis]
MPVFHIVLFKLKAGVTPAQIDEFKQACKAMVGQVPGLREMHNNAPLAITASRAKGYDMGLLAILEKPDDVQVYAAHPAHQVVQKIREEICEDALAYDMEF